MIKIQKENRKFTVDTYICFKKLNTYFLVLNFNPNYNVLSISKKMKQKEKK